MTNQIIDYTAIMQNLAHLSDEQMNCDLTNVCGGVFPPIFGELEVTFPAKCKGLFMLFWYQIEF